MNINGLKTNHIKTFHILSETFIYFQSSLKYCKPFEKRREEGKISFPRERNKISHLGTRSRHLLETSKRAYFNNQELLNRATKAFTIPFLLACRAIATRSRDLTGSAIRIEPGTERETREERRHRRGNESKTPFCR